jgi:hypothetical protein
MLPPGKPTPCTASPQLLPPLLLLLLLQVIKGASEVKVRRQPHTCVVRQPDGGGTPAVNIVLMHALQHP